MEVQSTVVLALESGTTAPHRHRELPVDYIEKRGRGQSTPASAGPGFEGTIVLGQPGWGGA